MKILSSVEAEPKLPHTDVISERKRGVIGTMTSDNIQKSLKWAMPNGECG
jgi:hypothetical protein